MLRGASLLMVIYSTTMRSNAFLTVAIAINADLQALMTIQLQNPFFNCINIIIMNLQLCGFE